MNPSKLLPHLFVNRTLTSISLSLTQYYLTKPRQSFSGREPERIIRSTGGSRSSPRLDGAVKPRGSDWMWMGWLFLQGTDFTSFRHTIPLPSKTILWRVDITQCRSAFNEKAKPIFRQYASWLWLLLLCPEKLFAVTVSTPPRKSSTPPPPPPPPLRIEDASRPSASRHPADLRYAKSCKTPWPRSASHISADAALRAADASLRGHHGTARALIMMLQQKDQYRKEG